MTDTATATAFANANATNAAQPLALDARQRSMLNAMGIHLWEAPFYEEKQAATQVKPAQTAIKNVVSPAGVSASAAVRDGASAGAATSASAHPTVARMATLPATASSATSSLRTDALGATAAPASVGMRAPLNAIGSSVRQPLPAGIASMDWLQLQTAVQSCQACNLCESRKNTVFGVGQPSTEPALAPRADWLIVGEAPGENEDIQGEPFVGQAGKLLDNMLRAMVPNGQPLARHSNVFIANVLKCRPPANRNPSADEVAMCQPYLLRQIALLQPKIILAMGRFAVQALTGSTEPLGKLRGRVHALSFGDYQAPVIVTYHPAYLLRNLPDKSKAWADLLLAMQTLQGQ
jgi:uracil-DNA glycosylase